MELLHFLHILILPTQTQIEPASVHRVTSKCSVGTTTAPVSSGQLNVKSQYIGERVSIRTHGLCGSIFLTSKVLVEFAYSLPVKEIFETSSA